METPNLIPPAELSGSRGDKLKTLDAAIAMLQEMRATLMGGGPLPAPPTELLGPYINAPVWPWFAAGWIVGALFVLLFLLAWTTS